MAAGKPLVLSRTRALTQYFGAAAVLTDNTPEAIVANVEQAHLQRLELPRRIADWIAANERYMGERIATLKGHLSALRRVPADESPGARTWKAGGDGGAEAVPPAVTL